MIEMVISALDFDSISLLVKFVRVFEAVPDTDATGNVAAATGKDAAATSSK